MYDREIINELLKFISELDGIGNKSMLASKVLANHNLIKERSVYTNNSYSIRFSQSKSSSFSNTVLSLRNLRKYDNKPFIVCLVTPNKNYLFLANSTMIDKVSHSSKKLTETNIVGSFNGGNIMKSINNIENSPDNFETLFELHENVGFDLNLPRLVENTMNVTGNARLFDPNPSEEIKILDSVSKTISFINSVNYVNLLNELDSIVNLERKNIIEACKVNNVNLRGREIEDIINNSGKIVSNNTVLLTSNDLSDYDKIYPNYNVSVDIKSKMLSKNSSPKGYNIDKFLKFLSGENNVYLIYIVAIDDSDNIYTKLLSVFDEDILDSTDIVHQWSGINSRGTAQFNGNVIKNLVIDDSKSNKINLDKSKSFLSNLISR